MIFLILSVLVAITYTLGQPALQSEPIGELKKGAMNVNLERERSVS